MAWRLWRRESIRQMHPRSQCGVCLRKRYPWCPDMQHREHLPGMCVLDLDFGCQQFGWSRWNRLCNGVEWHRPNPCLSRCRHWWDGGHNHSCRCERGRRDHRRRNFAHAARRSHGRHHHSDHGERRGRGRIHSGHEQRWRRRTIFCGGGWGPRRCRYCRAGCHYRQRTTSRCQGNRCTPFQPRLR
jgi:hypothetical protein